MLTNLKVQNAAPRDKDYKLSDSGGLSLFVTRKGHKGWRFKYRFGGKERRIIFGEFPQMTLAQARSARDAARRELQEGKDPGLVAKRRKLVRSSPSELTFERFAREWHAKQAPRWKEVHADDVITSLERDVFPDLGAFDMADIDETMVLAVLQKIEKRGAIETAHRVRQRISKIFKFARPHSGVKLDPTDGLIESMSQVPRSRLRPALLTFPELRELLAVVEHAGASPITKLASRFLALTAQRPGMIRRLRWEHLEGIDWCNDAEDAGLSLWRVPSDEIKQEFDLRQDEAFEHLVPLVPQAVDVLRVAHQLSGDGPYVFPSSRWFDRPTSENTIGYLYNREGYKGRHCPHGWRSAFSTLENERIGAEFATDQSKAFERLIVDAMLAHRPRGISDTEFAYNRAAHMERRRAIAAGWAQRLLDGLPAAATLLTGPRRRAKD
ncbi:MAG: tyrosine-type recombinase/integrase [Sphingomonas sp.]